MRKGDRRLFRWRGQLRRLDCRLLRRIPGFVTPSTVLFASWKAWAEKAGQIVRVRMWRIAHDDGGFQRYPLLRISRFWLAALGYLPTVGD